MFGQEGGERIAFIEASAAESLVAWEIFCAMAVEPMRISLSRWKTSSRRRAVWIAGFYPPSFSARSATGL
jgi:hypothetical protein